MSDNNGNFYGDNRGEESGEQQSDRTRYTPPVSTDSHHVNRESRWSAGSSNTYPPNLNDTGSWNRAENRGQDQHSQPSTQWDGYASSSRSDRQQPYRYNPQSGWQQGTNPVRNSNPYEWNFHDYDRFDRGRGRGAARKNRGLVVFTVSLVGILIISLVGLTGYSLLAGRQEASPAESGGAQTQPIPEIDTTSPRETSPLELASKPQTQEPQTTDGKLTIPEIAKLVSPSVVGVSSYNDTYYEPVSIGSGIVMSADGYIITNAHVVAGAAKYKVQLFDNSPYDAQLVGFDSTTDLAILKITASDLKAAVFGDSSQAVVGETVVAIGNPSGIELAGSVTRGIISAVNRTVSSNSAQFSYIQTDAAINPGNSGGALVNEYGQVIGITSAKIVAAGYEGIGFAIPITDAKPILDMLIESGRVTGRVMLGIGYNPVTEADSLKYGIPMGLEIREIYEISDLRNKDVQLGDILIEVNGERILTLPDVENIINEFQVGDEVTLRFYRRISTVQSTEFEVTVKLIEN
jgi:serine protease Do